MSEEHERLVKRLSEMEWGDFTSLQLAAERKVTHRRGKAQELLRMANLIVRELGEIGEERTEAVKEGDLLVERDSASSIRVWYQCSLVLKGNGCNPDQYRPETKWLDSILILYKKAEEQRNTKEREEETVNFLSKLEDWGLTIEDVEEPEPKEAVL